MTREVECPGAVALFGRVASMGRETSGERSARFVVHGDFSGRTLQWGRSLWERPNRVERLGAPDVMDRETQDNAQALIRSVRRGR